MNILFATTILPSARRTGGEIASQAFIDALRAAGHRVVVVGYRSADGSGGDGPDEVEVETRHIESRQARVRALGWLADALRSDLAYSATKYRSSAYLDRLGSVTAATSFAFTVVDHAQMGWLVGAGALSGPYAYLAHNVEHTLYAEIRRRMHNPLLRAVAQRESRMILELERTLVQGAAVTWTLTQEDVSELRRLDASAAMCSFALAPRPPAADPSHERDVDVGLLGTWTWSANRAGLEWFLEQVVPLLAQSTSVDVAGAGASYLREDRLRLRGLGRVADAGRFLGGCGAVAIPAVAGGGVQVKTLDAIAAGARIVATPLALRGIPEPPSTVTLARSPSEFAARLDEAVSTRAAPPVADARAWSEARAERFESDVAAAAERVGAT